MLTIRQARPEDTALVFDFIRELAVYERLDHEVVASPGDVSAALFGPSPRVFCDIAEWDAEPAGFALWFYNFSTFRGRHGLYLEDLFVRPAHRGRGIGKALLTHLARRCAAEGLGRMDWAVLDWNAAAIAFYDRLGARPVSDWIGYRLTGEALEALAATGD